MEVKIMPTKNPRLNVVLEPNLYKTLNKLAHKEGISLSLAARDLIKEALEIHEDLYWQKSAQKREKTFSSKKSLSHKETWE
jgi:predicted DNA-binding protein